MSEESRNFEEFLRSRGISEEAITYFDNEKIDEETILLLEEDTLKESIPKRGDRLAVLDFCRKRSSPKKQSLIEKLRAKMINRSNGLKDASTSKGLRKCGTKPKKATRIIELGWLHSDSDSGSDDYRYVRERYGGGNRKLSMPVHWDKNKIKETAENLFFPNGKSSEKGHLRQYETDLFDFKRNEINESLTIEEIFDLTKVTKLRFYLATKKKPATATELDLDNEDTNYQYIEDFNNDSHHENVFRFEEIFSVNVADTEPEMTEDASFNYEINTNTTQIRLHRGKVFEELLELFYHEIHINQIQITMILPNGDCEAAEDIGGVLRDALSEFWETFYERFTLGTNFKVPYVRHDFKEKQWTAVAKILKQGFQIMGYFPIRLAPTFIEKCLERTPESEDLIKNFSLFVSEGEKKVIEQGLHNFDDLDVDELHDFLQNFKSKWAPTRENFNELITDLAYKEIIQKPSFIIKCFQTVLNSLRIDLKEIYKKCQPSARNIINKFVISNEQSVSPATVQTFDFLKKFVREIDDKSRSDFLRFCTGSDIVMDEIRISFLSTHGFSRSPIAHTCSSTLQIPCTYDNFIEFRMEFLNLLNSNIWIMDIV